MRHILVSVLCLLFSTIAADAIPFSNASKVLNTTDQNGQAPAGTNLLHLMINQETFMRMLLEKKLVHLSEEVEKLKRENHPPKQSTRKDLTTSAPKAVNNGCKPDWVRFKNKCYLFSSKGSPWKQSVELCQAFQTKLAEPQTLAESKFLTTHSQKIGGGNFWLGITDQREERLWVYHSTSTQVKITDWNPGQPNNGRVSNCGCLWDAFCGRWADEPCTRHYKYICEEPSQEDGPDAKE